MENLLFAIVCGPFAVIATVLNVIFLFCLHHPAEGVNLRQPLRFLLIALIGNSLIQQGTIVLTVLLAFLQASELLLIVSKAVVYLTYSSCFSSSAWISIFYYIKIVPHTCALLNWIKKNIRIIACSGFILDQTVLLTAMSIGTASHLLPLLHPPNSASSPFNGTMSAEDNKLTALLLNVCNLIFFIYLICPLLTLTASWIKTFVYLRGHISRMKQTKESSTSSQLKNQMRVTVMGIVQAAVFLPSCSWTLFTVFVYSTPTFVRIDGNKHILITISSISDLAIIVCLGFSQSVFRLRAASALKRLKKALGILDHTDTGS